MEFPVKILASPAVILLLLALLLVMLHQLRPGAAKAGSLLLFLLIWGATTKPLVDQLAAPLELQYPAYDKTAHPQPLQHIWVLGCNHQDSHFLPLTSQLEPCSLARVSEGIRLWHQQPTALLHFSGRIDDRLTEHSDVARRYAIAMGVAPDHIRLHQQPQNTREEIQSLLAATGQDHVALVTSAMHMPRTMRWVAFYQQMQAKRGQIIAAPTDFSVRRLHHELKPSHFIPTVTAISALGYVHYEYLGLVLQQWQMSANTTSVQNTEASSGVPDLAQPE